MYKHEYKSVVPDPNLPRSRASGMSCLQQHGGTHGGTPPRGSSRPPLARTNWISQSPGYAFGPHTGVGHTTGLCVRVCTRHVQASVQEHYIQASVLEGHVQASVQERRSLPNLPGQWHGAVQNGARCGAAYRTSPSSPPTPLPGGTVAHDGAAARHGTAQRLLVSLSFPPSLPLSLSILPLLVDSLFLLHSLCHSLLLSLFLVTSLWLPLSLVASLSGCLSLWLPLSLYLAFSLVVSLTIPPPSALSCCLCLSLTHASLDTLLPLSRSLSVCLSPELHELYSLKCTTQTVA